MVRTSTVIPSTQDSVSPDITDCAEGEDSDEEEICLPGGGFVGVVGCDDGGC